MKKAMILLLALALAGCAGQKTVTTATAPVSRDTSGLFSDRDYEAAYGQHTAVTLEGTKAQWDGDGVKIDGTTLTVTKAGTYVFTGTLTNGQIRVEADKQDKVQLVLDGVTVENTTTAALYVDQADKVFLTMAQDSENTLSSTGTFQEGNVDGAVFSREDLTCNGQGTLIVASAAGHGIVSKDELTVTGGVYDITAASHGIQAKDSVAVDGGTFQIAAGKDGIHSENSDDATLGLVYVRTGTFRISAEGDGISAAGWMSLEGGSYEICTGGGSENGEKKTSQDWGAMGGGMGPGGMGNRPGRPGQPGQMEPAATQQSTEDSASIKGIKAASLEISGGSYTINAADDGIHANGDVTVTGGRFEIASGDDGIHADETLSLANAAVTVTESYEGLEGLHVVVESGTVTLTATDDGINAAGGTDQSGMGGRDGFGPGGMSAGNGSIRISGGTVDITASGDGVDANGTLEITGGQITVCGPNRGDTATLDYDVSGTISGGTFLGTGASGMAQSFSGGDQGVLALQMAEQPADTRIQVTDSSGQVLLEHTPALAFSVVILSDPQIEKGESYTVTVGSQSGTFAAS